MVKQVLSESSEHEKKYYTQDIKAQGFMKWLKQNELSLMRGATRTFKEVTSSNKRHRRGRESDVCWLSRHDIKWALKVNSQKIHIWKQ